MTTGAICPIARLRHWVAGLALLAACSLLPHPVLAQTYFPPTATNDWRTLLPAPGATPDAAAQQLIRDTVSLDWAQLEEAWDYSALFHPNSALLIIRDGWVAGEWGIQAE